LAGTGFRADVVGVGDRFRFEVKDLGDDVAKTFFGGDGGGAK
jgi:hypothetical protein